jgi:hypothetical protein
VTTLARVAMITVIVLVANSAIGYVMAWHRPAVITEYAATTPQPKFVFVELAGLANSGTITSAPYRPMLRRHGPVLVVDYARYAFSAGQISRMVIDAVRRVGLLPIFDAQSMGSMLGVKIMRDFDAAGLAIGGFISDCGPDTGDDVKWPVSPDALKRIPGGPLTNWAIDAVQLVMGLFDGQRSMPHGDSEALYRRHRWYMHTFPIQGSKAQAAFMVSAVGVRPGEFVDVPALLFRVENDVLVHTEMALPKLEAGFSNHATFTVPGVHANRVENPTERRLHIDRWITGLEAAG